MAKNSYDARQASAWTVDNFGKPLLNAALLEPYIVLSQTAKRLTGASFMPVGQLLETQRCQRYSREYWVQTVAYGAGSVLPYTLSGRLACGALRAAGAAARLQGLAAAVAQSDQAGQIVGAALYAGLQEARPGESRLANAGATATAFALFEAGDALSARKHFLPAAAIRLVSGAAGSAAQIAVSQAGKLGSCSLETQQELTASAAAGAVMNLLRPAARSALSRAEDQTNLALRLGVPLDRYLHQSCPPEQLSALQPELKRLLASNTWARVQTGAGATTYRWRADLVELRGDRPRLACLIHELQHRQDALLQKSEPAFRLAASYLQAGDEQNAWRVYRQTRLAAETGAHLTEISLVTNRSATITGLKHNEGQRNSIANYTTSCGLTYQQIWAGEFAQFKKTAGRFRPLLDYACPDPLIRLEQQRNRLIKLVAGKEPEIKDAIKEVEQSSKTDPACLADIYHDLSRLFLSPDKVPLQRKPYKLAVNLLDLVADPSGVTQGMHPTCAPAAVEYLTYAVKPSAAVHLVTEAARLAQVSASDGGKIALSDLSLCPERYGGRSPASQIFQNAAVNIYWQRQDRFRCWTQQPGYICQPAAKGSFRYERVLTDNLDESPYRLMDYTKTPPVGLVESLAISGDPANPFMTRSAVQDIFAQLHEVGAREIVLPENPATPGRLAEMLDQAKRAGQLPAIMAVHTGTQPFVTRAAASNQGGWHSLVVTDFDRSRGHVSIFNPWGRHAQSDGFTINELWLASREPIKSH